MRLCWLASVTHVEELVVVIMVQAAGLPGQGRLGVDARVVHDVVEVDVEQVEGDGGGV
jgi:hypothetical protein